MEHSVTTAAFDQALSRTHERVIAADRIERGAPPPPLGPADTDLSLQQAVEEHSNRMMVANGLYLVGGGLIASIGLHAFGLAAIGCALLATAVVLQREARRKLLAVLVEHARANGASNATARAKAAATLETMLR